MMAQKPALKSRQKAWGWSVISNFFLIGAATGYYILSFLETGLTWGPLALQGPVNSGLLAVVMVCLGFLLVAVEAGRPLRGYHMLKHLSRSWMSREVMAMVLFVISAVIVALYPHPWLSLLAAASALGLMASQGLIVFKARSVIAWNMPVIPVFFLTSGFASGYGLLLMTKGFGSPGIGEAQMLTGIAFVILNMTVWLFYLRWAGSVSFVYATRALRRPAAMVFIVGIGHVLPMLLIGMFTIAAKGQGAFNLPYIITALSGLALILGVAGQKAGIILAAGYTREIAIGS